MFIVSLLLARHHCRPWRQQQIKVCDVKELQIYAEETSNKQINKCTYNIGGNDNSYGILKQEIIVQEVCNKYLMLTEFLVCPILRQTVMLLILANGP